MQVQADPDHADDNRQCPSQDTERYEGAPCLEPILQREVSFPLRDNPERWRSAQPLASTPVTARDPGVEVTNAQALVELFGGWPSFHDAEVYNVSLDSGQRLDGCARLRLDVHVFETERPPSGDAVRFLNHSLVTLEFDEIEAVELDGFGPQNVLDDLVLEEVNLAAGKQIQVSMPASNGLAGSFRCRAVTVLETAPFQPGEHSVYRP